MPLLHERTSIVNYASSVLAHVLIEWYSTRQKADWSWERVCKALLDCERRCLFESLGEGDKETYVFDGRDALALWVVIEKWRGDHGVTWLEAARVIHHEVSPLLNYALRGERHPDDLTGARKADEA